MNRIACFVTAGFLALVATSPARSCGHTSVGVGIGYGGYHSRAVAVSAYTPVVTTAFLSVAPVAIAAPAYAVAAPTCAVAAPVAAPVAAASPCAQEAVEAPPVAAVQQQAAFAAAPSYGVSAVAAPAFASYGASLAVSPVVGAAYQSPLLVATATPVVVDVRHRGRHHRRNTVVVRSGIRRRR